MFRRISARLDLCLHEDSTAPPSTTPDATISPRPPTLHGATPCQSVAGNPYLLRQSLQLLRVNITPNLLHIVPIGDNPMFQRIPYLQQSSQFLRLCPDEDIPIDCPRHNTRVFRTANTMISVFRGTHKGDTHKGGLLGWEEGFGDFFAGVACFDHSRAIVEDHRGEHIVHFGSGLGGV